MPEFKLTISDPLAGEEFIEMKVKGVEDIGYGSEEKEKRKLPIAKVNHKLFEKLPSKSRVYQIKATDEKGETVKITVRAEADEKVPENEVWISLDLIGEKIGVEEVEKAKIYRAKAWQIVLDSEKSSRLIGLKIGDVFDAALAGLPGLKLRITGGSDSSGFPMRPDLPGPVKKKVLLSGPPGFHPREKGERRRKMVRGNTISEDTVQINTVIVYSEEEKK